MFYFYVMYLMKQLTGVFASFSNMCALLLFLDCQVHEPKEEEVHSDKPFVGKEGAEL